MTDKEIKQSLADSREYQHQKDVDETKKRLQQFMEMKRMHPDAILLFRVGDTYETYSGDGRYCAELLDLTLEVKKYGRSKTVRTCFPQLDLDRYIRIIVRSGKRVAICEQIKNPKIPEWK